MQSPGTRPRARLIAFDALVLWQTGVDAIRPGENAACEVLHVYIASCFQRKRSLLAARAGLAVDDNLVVLADRDVSQARLDLAQRDLRDAEVDDGVLVRLAHIEHERRGAG